MTDTGEKRKIRELTMDAGEANVYALVFVIPVFILFGLPFYLIHLKGQNAETLLDLLNNNLSLFKFRTLVVLLSIFAGIILHELIHGITFLFFCKNGLKSIRFGIMWKFFTPYCHCKEPLKVRHYIVGALMPAIVLGFIPAIVGVITGQVLILLFGILFSLAAGGLSLIHI